MLEALEVTMAAIAQAATEQQEVRGCVYMCVWCLWACVWACVCRRVCGRVCGRLCGRVRGRVCGLEYVGVCCCAWM